MKKSGNMKVVETTDLFKKVPKSILDNNAISCEALGVYTRILSLGRNWNLHIKGLSSFFHLSIEKTRRYINLLEKEGYILRTPIRLNGKFAGWEYTIVGAPVPKEKRTKAGKGKTQTRDTVTNMVTPNSKIRPSFERLNNCFSTYEYEYMERVIKEMSYNDFLVTPYWKTISTYLRKMNHWACAECGSTKYVQVHHKCYDHHGDELHHLDDLVCLCKECHKKKHNIE